MLLNWFYVNFSKKHIGRLNMNTLLLKGTGHQATKCGKNLKLFTRFVDASYTMMWIKEDLAHYMNLVLGWSY